MTFDPEMPIVPCDAKPEVKAALQDLTLFCGCLAEDGTPNESAVTHILMLAHGPVSYTHLTLPTNREV